MVSQEGEPSAQVGENCAGVYLEARSPLCCAVLCDDADHNPSRFESGVRLRTVSCVVCRVWVRGRTELNYNQRLNRAPPDCLISLCVPRYPERGDLTRDSPRHPCRCLPEAYGRVHREVRPPEPAAGRRRNHIQDQEGEGAGRGRVHLHRTLRRGMCVFTSRWVDGWMLSGG